LRYIILAPYDPFTFEASTGINKGINAFDSIAVKGYGVK